MATLDTRGFMDGALRGFEVMNNYQNQKADRARQEKLDQQSQERLSVADERYKQEKERQANLDAENTRRYEDELSLKQADAALKNKEYEFNYGSVDENGVKTKGYKQKKADQELQLNNQRIKTQKSQDEVNKAILAEKKQKQQQTDYKAQRDNNQKITEQKWIDSANGDIDTEYFDQPWIKGTEQDIRVWDNKKIDNLSKAKGYMQEVIAGKRNINDESMLKAFDSIYRDSFARSIGSVDRETGKVIKDYTVERIHPARDINPDLPGDQPGLTILGKVTYDDGTVAYKPVTENRSTDNADNVKVIPVENIIQDITQKTKMARVATAALKGNKVFNKGNVDTDFVQKKQLKYLDQQADLSKQKSEEISNLLEPTPAAIQAINQRYEAEEEKLKKRFFTQDSGKGDFGQAAFEWAKGDERNYDDGNKTQFLSTLISKGYNISEMRPEFLEYKYQQMMQANQNRINQENTPQQQPAPGTQTPVTNSQSIVDNIVSTPTQEQPAPVNTAISNRQRNASLRNAPPVEQEQGAVIPNGSFSRRNNRGQSLRDTESRPDLIRPDGTKKGTGFLGVLKNEKGQDVTEYSVGVQIDGKEIDVPTLVPTLTDEEIQIVLKASATGEQLPNSIIEKATRFAQQRLANGESQYAVSGNL